jgi:hypothetical protein
MAIAIRWSGIGHRIASGATPWMTASETLQSQPRPAKNAVRLNCFQKYAEHVGVNRQPEFRPTSKESGRGTDNCG